MNVSTRTPLLALMSLLACTAGCSASTDDTSGDGQTDQKREEISAPSCAPSLADGAVPGPHRAMLDTIAFTEGTAGSCGEDGYNTAFAYHCFTSCAQHPGIAYTAGGYTSTASGRYQFLNTTWAGLGLPNFGPANQDRGAMKLVARRGVSLPDDRALDATEFSNAMKKLSYEWASLPFSPYGQPTKSLATTRAKYCSFVDCSGATVSSCSVHADGKLYCKNTPGAAMHADPNYGSAVVNHLRTNPSWFECWTTGQLHPGGNTTWYRTIGDDNPNRGFVPAIDMGTTSEFDANPSAQGLAACP